MKTTKIIESYATPPDNNLWLKLDIFGNKLGIFKNVKEDFWEKINEYIWRMEESTFEPFDTSKIWVKINEDKEIIDILEYKNSSWTSVIPKPKQAPYLVTDIQCWAQLTGTGEPNILFFDNFIDIFPYAEETETTQLIPYINATYSLETEYPNTMKPSIDKDKLIGLQCIHDNRFTLSNMMQCTNFNDNFENLKFVTIRNCQMWYRRLNKEGNTFYGQYAIRTKFSEEFLNQYSISNE